MKILMQNRVDAMSMPGGDTVQMVKTKEFLEKLGHEVEISSELEPENIEQYDIIHIFNITRISEAYIQYKYAKKNNKKIAISTIYHSKKQIDYYEKNELMGNPKLVKNIFSNNELLELVKASIRWLKTFKGGKGIFIQLFKGYKNMQLELLKNVDLILPNSKMELQFMEEELGINIPKEKIEIVPNAIEIEIDFDEVDKNLFFEKYYLDKFVFCVGRIEPLKNQIRIMEALKDTNYKVVFAGKLSEKHKTYCEKFKYLVQNNDNFFYLGQLDRNILYSAYKNSKVTIIASWFETTGLVGLEAAHMRSNIVVTDRGYTKEYYKDYVEYCSPGDSNSILNAIRKSYNTNVSDKLLDELESKYNWENTAKITLEGYKKINL